MVTGSACEVERIYEITQFDHGRRLKRFSSGKNSQEVQYKLIDGVMVVENRLCSIRVRGDRSNRVKNDLAVLGRRHVLRPSELHASEMEANDYYSGVRCVRVGPLRTTVTHFVCVRSGEHVCGAEPVTCPIEELHGARRSPVVDGARDTTSSYELTDDGKTKTIEGHLRGPMGQAR